MAKSDLQDDSSNTFFIYMVAISGSVIFVVLMGFIIWRRHVNSKKILEIAGQPA